LYKGIRRIDFEEIFMNFAAAIAGAVIGIIAGLLPGFHTNLLAILIAGFHFDVWFSAIMLASLAVSRSVIDAVPTVFLGASENVMALLPGHRLLRKGCGVEAVKFCVLGSILGIIVCITLIPLFLIAFPLLYSFIKPWLFWILLLLIVILFVREWNLWALVVFLLSGFLGIIALDSAREPLFPLLSGLFGASGLLYSLLSRVEIPVQVDTDVLRMRKIPLTISVMTGVLAGSIVTLFPGLGPSQAAALAQVKKTKSLGYLVLVGALGTADVVISLVTFFVLGKARNGAVVVTEQLIGSLSPSALWYLSFVAIFAAGLAAIVALFASRWYARLIEFVDYSWLSLTVLIVLFIMSLILSGWLGLLIFITATAIGLVAPLTKISRSHSMGCLLLPTLILIW